MRVVWCLGMYASASTWLFNVVRIVGAKQGQVFTHFVSGALDEPAFEPDGLHIVKSHEIDDAASVEWLGRRADRIFVTIRDPRDAVTSLMLYHGFGFDRALDHVDRAARLCVRLAADGRSVLLAYESGFFEQPDRVQMIATHLNLPIADGERDNIFAAMRRDAVEAHIAKLPSLPRVLQDRVSGDMLDRRIHWHTHHAGRSGEIGRWKHQLTAAQQAAVARKLQCCFRLEA